MKFTLLNLTLACLLTAAVVSNIYLGLKVARMRTELTETKAQERVNRAMVEKFQKDLMEAKELLAAQKSTPQAAP